MWPPDRVSIGSKVVKELRLELRKPGGEGENSAGEAGRWDFDRLVGKWKRVVKDDRSRRIGGLAVHTRPTDIQETPPQTAAAAGPAREMQDIRRGGASAAEEPRRRSARTQGTTSIAGAEDTIREFKDAVVTNGDGK